MSKMAILGIEQIFTSLTEARKYVFGHGLLEFEQKFYQNYYQEAA